MFGTYYDTFKSFIVPLITNFQRLIDAFFTDTLRSLLGDISLDFAILDYTIAQLVLGAGLITFLTITLVKWAIDIVT